jgi:predicted Zn-dependent protease
LLLGWVALHGRHARIKPEQLDPEARASASRALDLDPRSGEAVAVMAYLDLRYEWKWQEADAGFQRAVALAPDSAHVRHWRGFQRSMAGRHAEAITELEIAHRLDPVERQISTNLAVARIWGGDVERGMALLRELIFHDPRFSSAGDRLRMATDAEGRIEESLAKDREMVRLGILPKDMLDLLEHGWKQGGAKGYFQARLQLV